MIYLINFCLMILCLFSLIWFLLKTRGRDNLAWWLLRFLVLHGMVCVIYMSYEAWQLWDNLPTNLLFIRLGFVSMTLTLLLLWHLLRQQRHDHRQQMFMHRINAIIKDRS